MPHSLAAPSLTPPHPTPKVPCRHVMMTRDILTVGGIWAADTSPLEPLNARLQVLAERRAKRCPSNRGTSEIRGGKRHADAWGARAQGPRAASG
jgi:hypothetical protein